MTRENKLPNPLPSRCADCIHRLNIDGVEHCISTMHGYCMEQERTAKFIKKRDKEYETESRKKRAND